MVEPIGAVRDTQTYSIIGAAMEVHRVFGCGFLEAPYSAALKVELHLRGIPFAAEMSFLSGTRASRWRWRTVQI